MWFNNQGWPSAPIFTNLLSNALLRSALPPGADAGAHGIFTYNHPMNSTTAAFDIDASAGNEMRRQSLEVLLLLLAFSVVPASFVLFLIDERVSHAKHLQFVSGLNPLLYWIANFAWDMVTLPIISTAIRQPWVS